MSFDSLTYLIFLAIVLTGFYVLPHSARWLWLLLASCYFYMVLIPIYILLLFAIIFIDYGVGLMLETSEKKYRRLILAISLLTNIGTLFVFKYFNFFYSSFRNLLAAFHIFVPSYQLEWLLPLGLSFHTFQSMSYTLEVYYGRQKAMRHLGKLACYVMFFPQLVAGPIERPQHFLPQLSDQKKLDLGFLASGLGQILFGLFKKMVVADNLGGLVDPVFSGQLPNTFWFSLFAIVGFSLQIYMDFSGYCHIALGSAKLFGFHLSQNFDSPYSATSISEFWKRWHITLSQWFRDYLYIPLGGSRTSFGRTQLNVFIVFLISGLWHGANWTFVLWGCLHGAALILENCFAYIKKHLPIESKHWRKSKGIAWLFTFSFVCIAWTYFRSSSIDEANRILLGLFNHSDFRSLLSGVFFPSRYFLGLFLGISILILESDSVGERFRYYFFERLSPFWRVSIYAFATVAILNLGVIILKPFIYFQF